MIAEASAHPDLRPVHEALALGLARVRDRFDHQLQSPEAAIHDLTTHVGRYRGKMLRPVLTLLCGLAAQPAIPAPFTSTRLNEIWNDDHILSAAVCEMVHMATLVHDDILDEADVRRGVRTINALKGNEAAVMLGDLLIAHAYDLANNGSTPMISRVVSQAAVAVCSGELLQLSQRGNLDLSREEYFRIVAGKTGALIAAACRLGAISSGADSRVATALANYGDLLGTAFQIQDDILDLTGDEATVGKSVRKDLEKGKMTLPLIFALDPASPVRGRVRPILAAVGQSGLSETDELQLGISLSEAGSIAAARQVASELVARAKKELGTIAPSPVKSLLDMMADAVIDRAF